MNNQEYVNFNVNNIPVTANHDALIKYSKLFERILQEDNPVLFFDIPCNDLDNYIFNESITLLFDTIDRLFFGNINLEEFMKPTELIKKYNKIINEFNCALLFRLSAYFIIDIFTENIISFLIYDKIMEFYQFSSKFETTMMINPKLYTKPFESLMLLRNVQIIDKCTHPSIVFYQKNKLWVGYLKEENTLAHSFFNTLCNNFAKYIGPHRHIHYHADKHANAFYSMHRNGHKKCKNFYTEPSYNPMSDFIDKHPTGNILETINTNEIMFEKMEVGKLYDIYITVMAYINYVEYGYIAQTVQFKNTEESPMTVQI